MMSDWIKILSQFDEEEVPEGWATTSQISEELKLPMETVYKRLKRRLARGEVEKKSFIMKGRKLSIWKPKKC
ncbi:MAG: hypothetical protein CMM02_05255 [Rhodopirellula sp.]|jgi:predicted transcriptional regulator|nr:hypothetical protein [Rhodopirellula sp.]|tara:strand:- start:10952 stop:11167 length:216 start_codon:yes stop_codon:yes gene_type:complete